MKSRFCSPSAMPARCDLNRRIGLPDLASSNRLATRLIISPLWYSLGPNTLKNFRPTHCGGNLSPRLARSATAMSNRCLLQPYRFIGRSASSAAAQPAPFHPVLRPRRRHAVREPALGEIAPLPVVAEQVANSDVGAARVV